MHIFLQMEYILNFRMQRRANVRISGTSSILLDIMRNNLTVCDSNQQNYYHKAEYFVPQSFYNNLQFNPHLHVAKPLAPRGLKGSCNEKEMAPLFRPRF